MPNTTYTIVDFSEFSAFFQAHRTAIYQDDFAFSLDGILNPDEKAKRKTKAQHLEALDSFYLLAKINGQAVGWSYGIQKSADDYFMRNSAVLPAYRKAGIYTGMLQYTVQHLSQQGYQRIYSLHKMDNNPILIAKLKFGFVLTGFKVSERNGCMAELTWFTNSDRKKLYQVRVGSAKPDSDVLQHLV